MLPLETFLVAIATWMRNTYAPSGKTDYIHPDGTYQRPEKYSKNQTSPVSLPTGIFLQNKIPSVGTGSEHTEIGVF